MVLTVRAVAATWPAFRQTEGQRDKMWVPEKKEEEISYPDQGDQRQLPGGSNLGFVLI